MYFWELRLQNTPAGHGPWSTSELEAPLCADPLCFHAVCPKPTPSLPSAISWVDWLPDALVLRSEATTSMVACKSAIAKIFEVKNIHYRQEILRIQPKKQSTIGFAALRDQMRSFCEKLRAVKVEDAAKPPTF